jgi:hypothetical protein
MPTINNNLIIWNKMIQNSMSQQHLKQKINHTEALHLAIMSSLFCISIKFNYSDSTVEKNLATLK